MCCWPPVHLGCEFAGAGDTSQLRHTDGTLRAAYLSVEAGHEYSTQPYFSLGGSGGWGGWHRYTGSPVLEVTGGLALSGTLDLKDPLSPGGGANLSMLSTSAENLAGLAALTVVCDGTGEAPTTLEVGGEDLGADPAGFTGPIALGSLHVVAGPGAGLLLVVGAAGLLGRPRDRKA